MLILSSLLSGVFQICLLSLFKSQVFSSHVEIYWVSIKNSSSTVKSCHRWKILQNIWRFDFENLDFVSAVSQWHLETLFPQIWPFRWFKQCRVVSVSTSVVDVSKVCTFHLSPSTGLVLTVWCLSTDQPPPFKAEISWLELSRLAGMLFQAQGMHRCFGCLCCAQDISNSSSAETLSSTVVFHTQLLNNAVYALVWLLWQSV